MEPKNCTCHAPVEEVVQKCPPHQYGPGWVNLEHGVRVSRTQICRVCEDRLDTPITEENKPKGPQIFMDSAGAKNLNGGR